MSRYGLSCKPKLIPEWPAISDLSPLRDLDKPTVTMKELRDILKKTKPYYLDERGLSVNAKGDKISEDLAFYKWGILKGWETQEGEQLYVWMHKDLKDGKFKFVTYGTRMDFDKEIAEDKYNSNKENTLTR